MTNHRGGNRNNEMQKNVQTPPNIAFYINNKLNPDLFSDVAEKWARTIGDAGKLGKNKNKNKNKNSQIHRFYGEVLRFQDQIREHPDRFDNLLPYLYMLRARTAYAEARLHVTWHFSDFINNCLNEIKKKEESQTVDIFASFFEAFMGFYKKYSPAE